MLLWRKNDSVDYKILCASLFLLLSLQNVSASDIDDISISLYESEIDTSFQEDDSELESVDLQSSLSIDSHIFENQQFKDQLRGDLQGSLHVWNDVRAAKLAKKPESYYDRREAFNLKKQGGILSEKEAHLAQLHEDAIAFKRKSFEEGKNAFNLNKSGGILSEEQRRYAQLYENQIIAWKQSRENKKNAFNSKKEGGDLTEGEELLAQLYEKKQADGRKRWSDKKNAFDRKKSGEILSEREKHLVGLYEKDAISWKKRWQNIKNACDRKKEGGILSEAEELLVQSHEKRLVDRRVLPHKEKNACNPKNKQIRKKARVESGNNVSSDSFVDTIVIDKLDESASLRNQQAIERVQVNLNTESFGVKNVSIGRKKYASRKKSADQHENKLVFDRIYQKQRRAEKKEALELEKKGEFLSDVQKALIAAYVANIPKQQVRQRAYLQKKKACLGNAKINK